MRLIDWTSDNIQYSVDIASLTDTRRDIQVGSKQPLYAVIDQRYNNLLLIVDFSNKAVRTVDVVSPIVGRFEKSNSLKYIKSITQDQKSGDVYVTVPQAVYRITYIQRTVTLILGSTDSFSYKESTQLDSLFDWPHELIFITPHTRAVSLLF